METKYGLTLFYNFYGGTELSAGKYRRLVRISDIDGGKTQVKSIC